MNEIIVTKLIRKEEITDTDLENMLYEICEREHSELNPHRGRGWPKRFGCSNDCPIYKRVLTEEEKEGASCNCFKNGKRMLEALRMAIKVDDILFFINKMAIRDGIEERRRMA